MKLIGRARYRWRQYLVASLFAVALVVGLAIRDGGSGASAGVVLALTFAIVVGLVVGVLVTESLLGQIGIEKPSGGRDRH
jgi:tetrahydromethanopterin S-methyltransferase subunit C